MQMHETDRPDRACDRACFVRSSAPTLGDDVVFEFDEDVAAPDALITAGEDQEDIAVAFFGLFVGVLPELVTRFDLALFRRIPKRCNNPRLAGFARLDLGERVL